MVPGVICGFASQLGALVDLAGGCAGADGAAAGAALLGAGGGGAFATSAFLRHPAGSTQARRMTIASCFGMRGLHFTVILRRERGPSRASRDYLPPDALGAHPLGRLIDVISDTIA